MLFGNDSISHYTRSNAAVWMAMAFQAGIVNVGGFLACHRFVSHVTGFATYFGLEVDRTNASHALGMLLVPFFFLLGAVISGLLVDLRLKLRKKPRYYVTFGIMFGILLGVAVGGVLGAFGAFGEPSGSAPGYALLILLCLVCGIQNGTITTVSKAIVRTTHLTGVTTDLGIGIVRYVYRKTLIDKDSDEHLANLMRIGIIVFFVLGSVIGSVTFRRLEYGGFFVPALTSGLLFALMLYFQVIRKPYTRQAERVIK